MNDYEHSFEAKIVKYDFGTMVYTVVYVPKRILAKLDFSKSKRLRIDGEVNGVRVDAAMMPAKGKWYVMVSKKLQKQCGLTLGDVAIVRFNVADPDSITIPRELERALNANDRAMKVWNQMTAGKRRGFCYRVASAKMPETRERRVFEVMETLAQSIN